MYSFMSSDVGWRIRDQLWPVPIKAWFSVALLPQKPQGSLGRKAQDGHLDFHTAGPWTQIIIIILFVSWFGFYCPVNLIGTPEDEWV